VSATLVATERLAPSRLTGVNKGYGPCGDYSLANAPLYRDNGTR